jgi:hypothetical protein
MATRTTLAHRLLLAGGFAVAVSAGPLVAGLATPAGSPLAVCPPNEVLDPATGVCTPVTVQAPTTFNPVDPGIAGLQPGSVTSGQPGEVGRLPEVNGIPCNGENTGLCIGLEQNNPAGAPGAPTLAPVVPGVQG